MDLNGWSFIQCYTVPIANFEAQRLIVLFDIFLKIILKMHDNQWTTVKVTFSYCVDWIVDGLFVDYIFWLTSEEDLDLYILVFCWIHPRELVKNSKTIQSGPSFVQVS